MADTHALSESGLSIEESRIYIAALELGSAGATDIAKKAGLQRTYFYPIAQSLITRGLLKQTREGGKSTFSAESPEKIVAIQKKKLDALEKKLPELLAITNTDFHKPKVYYYDGVSGINQINDDTLQHKGEILGFTSPRYITLDDGKAHRDYAEKRVAKRNRARIIGEISQEVMELQKKDKEELRETRMLPRELFNSEIELVIYGDRVAIIDYKEVFGLIIEGREIAKVLRMIFELTWQSGRVIRPR